MGKPGGGGGGSFDRRLGSYSRFTRPRRARKNLSRRNRLRKFRQRGRTRTDPGAGRLNALGHLQVRII